MKVFDLHDIEKEGSVQSGEVINAVKLLFKDFDDIPPQVELDIEQSVNGTEKVSYDKFKDIIEQVKRFLEKEGLKDAFRVIARKNPKNKGKTDEELCVDFEAVKKLLRMMFGDDAFSNEELDQMMHEADADGSNTIEIDEFVDYMMNI